MLLEGKKVFVGPFLKRTDRPADKEAHYTNIYVKNLAESVTEEQLEKMFGEHGKVRRAPGCCAGTLLSFSFSAALDVIHLCSFVQPAHTLASLHIRRLYHRWQVASSGDCAWCQSLETQLIPGSLAKLKNMRARNRREGMNKTDVKSKPANKHGSMLSALHGACAGDQRDDHEGR